jgi:inner membrane protein
MPTTITHAVIGAVSAAVLPKQAPSWRIYLAAIICSTLPDADVLAFRVGIPYDHMLGHRGLSHSIFFALVLSVIIVCCLFRKFKIFSTAWWGFVYFFFLVGLSHGILDAMTNGGMGIAFLAPFDNTRLFMPIRPLPVSPIGLSTSDIPWRLRVLSQEMIYIWLPLTTIPITAKIIRQKLKKQNQ